MKLNYIFGLLIIASFLSCRYSKSEKGSIETEPSISSDLEVDHFNIWVKNPNAAKQKLRSIGFTSVPDSLSEIHIGQGTAGKYFYFLNSYLELIFVHDQNELEENNRINKYLDFTERANFDINGASPFSLALKVKDYNLDKIPFQKIEYHQDWMEENASIYSAKNSKINLKEPSIFIVYPEIESLQFGSLADLKKIPNEYAFLRAFYKHPNGAKKVTKIIITSTAINLESETIKAVNTVKNLLVKNGPKHLMELYFDDGTQGKTFDLRPELPLKIYL